MPRLHLKPRLTDEQTASLAGKHLKESDCKHLITDDHDIYCEVTGKCLAKFRKNVIPSAILKAAYDNLHKVQDQFANTNRGEAAGFDYEEALKHAQRDGGIGIERHEDGVRFRIITKDGTVSNTNKALPVNSGIIGKFDRSPRFPYCRQTAFNQKHFDKFKLAYPVIKTVDTYYEKLMPENYKLQRAEAERTAKDFVIRNTAFTTVTVNRNWQTAVHTDKGDFDDGFGNLVAIRTGKYTGGHFVLPKWGVGFDLQNGDILFADVHQWHGNTPIIKEDHDAVRLSLVMYYRKNMIKCGSAQEELDRAKNRIPGSKINE